MQERTLADLPQRPDTQDSQEEIKCLREKLQSLCLLGRGREGGEQRVRRGPGKKVGRKAGRKAGREAGRDAPGGGEDAPGGGEDAPSGGEGGRGGREAGRGGKEGRMCSN